MAIKPTAKPQVKANKSHVRPSQDLNLNVFRPCHSALFAKYNAILNDYTEKIKILFKFCIYYFQLNFVTFKGEVISCGLR